MPHDLLPAKRKRPGGRAPGAFNCIHHPGGRWKSDRSHWLARRARVVVANDGAQHAAVQADSTAIRSSILDENYTGLDIGSITSLAAGTATVSARRGAAGVRGR